LSLEEMPCISTANGNHGKVIQAGDSEVGHRVYESPRLGILAQYMPMQPLDQKAGAAEAAPPATEPEPAESGGPPGPAPTRYGDWERKGRCIDF